MVKNLQKTEQDFINEVTRCLQKARGIKELMGKLEEALSELDQEDYNEIALAAMQDLNTLLGGLIKIWDQWASGMSGELDRLTKFERY